MEKNKNFACFKGGREEEILYYEYLDGDKNIVQFVTKSGIYLMAGYSIKDARMGKFQKGDFFKVITVFGIVNEEKHEYRLENLVDSSSILSIRIDERSQYEYVIYGNGGVIGGEITLSSDAYPDEIRMAIMEKLNIQWNKKE